MKQVVGSLRATAALLRFVGAAQRGIPTYGVAGSFYEADLGHIHGLNERIGVQSLYEGRDFLFDPVKIYANP
jgi:hypothetical protein